MEFIQHSLFAASSSSFFFAHAESNNKIIHKHKTTQACYKIKQNNNNKKINEKRKTEKTNEKKNENRITLYVFIRRKISYCFSFSPHVMDNSLFFHATNSVGLFHYRFAFRNINLLVFLLLFLFPMSPRSK